MPTHLVDLFISSIADGLAPSVLTVDSHFELEPGYLAQDQDFLRLTRSAILRFTMNGTMILLHDPVRVGFARMWG